VGSDTFFRDNMDHLVWIQSTCCILGQNCDLLLGRGCNGRRSSWLGRCRRWWGGLLAVTSNYQDQYGNYNEKQRVFSSHGRLSQGSKHVDHRSKRWQSREVRSSGFQNMLAHHVNRVNMPQVYIIPRQSGVSASCGRHSLPGKVRRPFLEGRDQV
jgi:hypothetical protein